MTGQQGRPRFEMPNLSDRENTPQGDSSDTVRAYSSLMTANSHKDPMKATVQCPTTLLFADSGHIIACRYKVSVGAAPQY
jgi:hypothetical protein